MKIKSNKLIDVRDFFNQELCTIYTKLEVDSFYYICVSVFSGLSRSALIANPYMSVSESELLKYNFAVKDLKVHRPIQYIVGSTPFANCNIKVNEHVLIPRPETEELVMEIVKRNKIKSPAIFDVCTGSGCIAIALKKHMNDASVFGCDISTEALQMAQQNALDNKAHVTFFNTDALKLVDLTDIKYDIIVSNPPYVLNSEKAQMSKNVLDYEPHLALFVNDADPLLFYKAIAQFAIKKLKPGGYLYFEINQQYAAAIHALLLSMGFAGFQVVTDLSGNHRFVVASL